MFEALEAAYQQRAPSLVWVRVLSHRDDVREHPLFQEMLRRLNYPQ